MLLEPGFVTDMKIVGMLIVVISMIPLLFLLSSGGDRSEPTEPLDDHEEH